MTSVMQTPKEGKKVEKKLVRKVPKTIIARKERNNFLKKKKLSNLVAKIKHRKASKAKSFVNAERYAKIYREVERSLIEEKRLAKKDGGILVPEQPKLAFVMRIRGVNQVAPKPRKVLKLFRLLAINNGVFVKLNKATINMLRIAEPFIAWGYPNLKTIKQLMYKRGFGIVKGQRKPIITNEIIEKNLGKRGIICMEDLIHEIYTVGPNFTAANRFLYPFKLNNPKGGWRKKTNHYVEGGDFGNRENKINIVLRKMI